MRYPHLIPTPSSLLYSFEFLLKSRNIFSCCYSTECLSVFYLFICKGEVYVLIEPLAVKHMGSGKVAPRIFNLDTRWT